MRKKSSFLLDRSISTTHKKKEISKWNEWPSTHVPPLVILSESIFLDMERVECLVYGKYSRFRKQYSKLTRLHIRNTYNTF